MGKKSCSKDFRTTQNVIMWMSLGWGSSYNDNTFVIGTGVF